MNIFWTAVFIFSCVGAFGACGAVIVLAIALLATNYVWVPLLLFFIALPEVLTMFSMLISKSAYELMWS